MHASMIFKIMAIVVHTLYTDVLLDVANSSSFLVATIQLAP